MRVWGRRFERDMRTMGESIARDVNDELAEASSGKTKRQDFWCGPWVWGPTDGFSDADTGEGVERRAREERRRERYERREARAREKAWAGWGGPMSLMHFWWLIFPLFFMGRGLLREIGGLQGLAAASGEWLTAMLNFTLAAPFARLLSSALGVSFVSAYGLLFALVVVTGAAAALGLKSGQPRRAL